jgi:hypothetical protein
MRGGERKEGPPNKERGDGVGDGSLQSHSGANLHPKTTKGRGNVLKGGEADGVALTALACKVPILRPVDSNNRDLIWVIMDG